MQWLAELIALFAPPGCAACGRALPGAGERLCVLCTRTLAWLPAGCTRCGLPSHRASRCPAAGAAFPRAWAPLAYDGVARRLVLGLKVRNAIATADLMAAQMAANLPADLRVHLTDPGCTRACDREDGPSMASGRSRYASRGSPAGVRAGGEATAVRATGAQPALVPVPTLPSRRRRRGFDPARVLTLALGRRLDVPVAECLVRVDRSARQVGAGRRERRAPGRLLVRARGSPPARAIIVDDVHTTGTTLDTCAQALAAAGTTVIAAVSYARTL